MGQDRSSVLCDDEGKRVIGRPIPRAEALRIATLVLERAEQERLEFADEGAEASCSVTGTSELAEAVAASVVMHAARIEDLRRRIETLEADKVALREALKEAFVSR
jgi:hypothetical protein